MADDLAPNYVIEIAGQELKSDVTQFINRLEFESADGVIDKATISADNPDSVLSSAKVFAPGNEMDLYFGYGPGGGTKFIGRVVLMAPKPSFPEDAPSTIEIVGYTKDYFMKDQRPIPKDAAINWLAGTKQAKIGMVYEDVNVDEVVVEKCLPYSFYPDVDDAPLLKQKIIQPARMSDYELIQGLANLTGFLFWVDYDLSRGWTLHFRDPSGNLRNQDKEYTFIHNQGNKTTLLSFEPEQLFQNHYTTLKIQSTDRTPGARFGKLMEVTLTEDLQVKEDTLYQGKIKEMDQDLGSAETVRIFIGDYSFAMKTNLVTLDEAELEMFARQWYRRSREQFIVGDGRVIGWESLFARQTHRLKGMGVPYDGRYYFSRVAHLFVRGEGYHCDFSARKVLAI